MALISMTGASGTIGALSVESLLKDPENRLRVLLRSSKRGQKTARRLKKRFGSRAEVLFGDVVNDEDCLRLLEGADYLLHLAAVIPPMADRRAEMTMKVNAEGTKKLIRAALECGGSVKFIFVSSVAVYGPRDGKHPWGRVGDPLLTSALDVYGQTKTISEFALMESGLKNWVILRESAVLYDNILLNNLSDGLMFHTTWDAPIEWVTAADSAALFASIVRSDRNGDAEGFWRRVYNVGGGEKARQTGYETFDDGFRLIGGSVENFFRPEWNCTRNFHCFWLSDSDELESRFHFRTQGCSDFWEWYRKRHRIYTAGRLIPVKLLRKMTIEPMRKDANAPSYWLEHNDEVRVQAFYGGRKAFEMLPKSWADTALFCKSPEYGDILRQPSWKKLDHGYDETKPDGELKLDDIQKAAAFRGGQCLSSEMPEDTLYGKIRWRCHEGHSFAASAYTVLKAGHWCPACWQTPLEWHTDRNASHSPFHAQVWLDSHEAGECFVYRLRDGKALMEEES